jgi:hypothetical protein
LPLPVMKKGRRRPLMAGHVATTAQAPNPLAPWLLCPRAALTSAFTPWPNPPRAPHQPLGVFPFPLIRGREGRRGEAGGVKAGEEEA